MRKLDKILKDKGILFDGSDFPYNVKDTTSTELFTVTKEGFIIMLWYSPVVPSRFVIYDRNFNEIGSQNIHANTDLEIEMAKSLDFVCDRWDSQVNV